MKFREVAEWEDHRIEPGGDEVCLLEAVDVPTDSPRYTRIPWALSSYRDRHKAHVG